MNILTWDTKVPLHETKSKLSSTNEKKSVRKIAGIQQIGRNVLEI